MKLNNILMICVLVGIGLQLWYQIKYIESVQRLHKQFSLINNTRYTVNAAQNDSIEALQKVIETMLEINKEDCSKFTK